MKKILISAALPLGIVASAQAVEVNILNNLSTTTVSSYTTSFGSTSGATSVNATTVQSWLSSLSANTIYYTTVSGGSSASPAATYSEGSLGFQNTYNYGGAVVGFKYTLSDADLSSGVSVSLSYTNISVGNSSCTNSIVGYVAIVYQTGDTWTISNTSSFTTTYGSNGNASVSLSGVTLSSSDIYLVVWTDKQASGSNTGYRISGTLAATATYAAIPEPSSFGLLAGIGALALVVSRRRRRCA